MERKTLIIGSGPCAVNIAEKLLAQGVNVVVAAGEKKNPTLEALKSDQAEILLKARMRDCNGFVGNFNVSMDVEAEKLERTVSNIIIAEEGCKASDVQKLSQMMADAVKEQFDLTLNREVKMIGFE